MKERTPAAEPIRSSEEPWPALEARWPIATWMSPWAFDESEAGYRGLPDGEPREPVRH